MKNDDVHDRIIYLRERSARRSFINDVSNMSGRDNNWLLHNIAFLDSEAGEVFGDCFLTNVRHCTAETMPDIGHVKQHVDMAIEEHGYVALLISAQVGVAVMSKDLFLDFYDVLFDLEIKRSQKLYIASLDQNTCLAFDINEHSNDIRLWKRQ